MSSYNAAQLTVQDNCGQIPEPLSLEIQRETMRRFLDELHFDGNQRRTIIVRAWLQNYITAKAAWDHLQAEGLLGTQEDVMAIYAEGVCALDAQRAEKSIEDLCLPLYDDEHRLKALTFAQDGCFEIPSVSISNPFSPVIGQPDALSEARKGRTA